MWVGDSLVLSLSGKDIILIILNDKRAFKKYHMLILTYDISVNNSKASIQKNNENFTTKNNES